MTDTAKPPLIQPGNPSTSDLKTYVLPGCTIVFQNGAMELGRNGATTEEVLDVLIEHISGFQKGPFACKENEDTLAGLQLAKDSVLARAKKRVDQGVKGREAAHA